MIDHSETEKSAESHTGMKLCSIASGSSGNCIFAGSDTTNILIDTGISKKRVEQGLEEIAVSPDALDGILITHEHSDHVKGLGVFSRKYKLPIYATSGTIDAIRKMPGLGKIDDDLFVPISDAHAFMLGDLHIIPIAISHDAAEPVAYRLECEEKQIAVITDLGTYDADTVDRLQSLDAMLLESNHDVRMLQVGSYPYYLKQRILGNKGHLSNETSAQLLCSLINDHMKQVLLGHLSQENNMEALAFETVQQEAGQFCREHGYCLPSIAVAHRDHVSQLVTV